VTTEDAKKFHDWEKSQMDNAIDIARKVGAEAPELTHEEMVEIAEEREAEPIVNQVEFVAVPPAPSVPAPVVAKPETVAPVKIPRMIPRVTRGIRGADKRG
jgi:hypothetical protein